MFKRFIFVCVMVVLASLAAGCGRQNESPTAGSSLDEAVQRVYVDREPVHIEFWTGTGAANLPFLEAMVDAFQEAYPHITVAFANQGPIHELTGMLTQNIVSRTTPALSNLNPETFPAYIDSNAIVDLMPFFTHPVIGFTAEEQAAFFQSYINEAMNLGPSGTMYGFPTNKKTTFVFVYNRTFFDSMGWDAPTTWDQVAEYSRIIFQQTGNPGFSFDTSLGFGAFKILSSQWGSPYVTPEGVVDIDNQASLDALNFFRSNMEAGYFTLPALMPSAGGHHSSGGFTMQECKMFIGSQAGIQFAIPNVERGHTPFEVGVAPIPQRDPARPFNFSMGENYAMFSNTTYDQRVATWLLIRFLSGAEENSEWLVNSGNLPISYSMMETAPYRAFLATAMDGSIAGYRAAAVRSALEMRDFMQFQVAFERAGALADAVGSMWMSIMVGGADPETALRSAAANFR
ncbi:MAG: extracellular solute-binding protein [Defluviitaleaceae bacterium]|nr:extracellular solute-binding protein [Defluviitaleaceae bacterium]